jgi:hypothetical protein
MAFCVITFVVAFQGGGGNFTAKVAEKLAAFIGRLLICAGILGFIARKAGKGYGLVTFSLVCACGALVFATYFHVRRETAKQEKRQLAESALDFYTNVMDFMQRGGTGSVPEVKFTGDRFNDAILRLGREYASVIARTFARMHEEIDGLGKQDVFEDAVLISKDVLAGEFRKRADSLKVLEKYRGGLAVIVQECKSKVGMAGLKEDEKRDLLRGLDGSLQDQAPIYNSVLDALAKKERAEREFLGFMAGAFEDYKLKDGKILFGANANVAKYKQLAKGVTDAANELEAFVKRLAAEGATNTSRIRAMGGIDPGPKG